MDVDDLRLLEAVAAEGSFSRAAARLRFSQPSVSARIAAVERAIGAELFARDSRGPPGGPAAHHSQAASQRFAIHSWSQDADEIISEMLAADTPGRHIIIVSPAATAIALALYRGYIAIVPRVTAAQELKAGSLRPIPIPLPK